MAPVLEPRTVKERVYDLLREHLLSGAIPLGGRLDEGALSEEIGVSRTPVRDAIGKLAKEGLVEYRRYQGNYVRALDVKHLSDLLELRMEMEALSARLAAARRTDSDLHELRRLVAEADEALARGDMLAYEAADARFHEAIARIAGNHALSTTLDGLAAQIQLARTLANRDADTPSEMMRDRSAIVDAIAAGDAGQAALLMRRHIEHARDAIFRMLRQPQD